MVQIGNEITAGLLWEDGRIGAGYEDNWLQFTTLVSAGINGVKDSFPAASEIAIMLHVSEGGSNGVSRWLFDNVAAQGIVYDSIGLSCYPWWDGTIDDLTANITDLTQRYQKEVIVVEVAYPWTLRWHDDTHNPVGLEEHLHDGFPATSQGQTDYLQHIMAAIQESGGAGFFYWEPAYLTTPDCGSFWENLALFDFQGNALSALQAFEP